MTGNRKIPDTIRELLRHTDTSRVGRNTGLLPAFNSAEPCSLAGIDCRPTSDFSADKLEDALDLEANREANRTQNGVLRSIKSV
jgi:hypothetical protein